MNRRVDARPSGCVLSITADSSWKSELRVMNWIPVASNIFARGTRSKAASIMVSVRLSR